MLMYSLGIIKLLTYYVNDVANTKQLEQGFVKLIFNFISTHYHVVFSLFVDQNQRMRCTQTTCRVTQYQQVPLKVCIPLFVNVPFVVFIFPFYLIFFFGQCNCGVQTSIISVLHIRSRDNLFYTYLLTSNLFLYMFSWVFSERKGNHCSKRHCRGAS